MNALPRERERLAAVLGLLGSVHDGEVLVAARTAERLRVAAGLSWPDLLMPPPPAPPQTPPDWRAMIAACQARPDRLTPWETAFVARVAAYLNVPSARQLELLANIHWRVRG